MKRKALAVVLLLFTLLAAAPPASARVRVHRGPRGRVVVRRGFPLRRNLPRVVVRGPRVAVRVAPRAYLAPIAFTAAVIATRPERAHVVWQDTAVAEHDDDWVDATLNADRRGDRMFLEIDQGAARISFAEVVFDNGEAQVVDFNDRIFSPGYYALLDFKDGRKVDHVRVVAKAEGATSSLAFDLIG